jgi:hypothetical protein
MVKDLVERGSKGLGISNEVENLSSLGLNDRIGTEE